MFKTKAQGTFISFDPIWPTPRLGTTKPFNTLTRDLHLLASSVVLFYNIAYIPFPPFSLPSGIFSL